DEAGPQPVLVVKPGEPVEISCEVSEDVESKHSLAWYQRGKDGPELLLECGKGTKRGFSCSYRRPTVTLSIASAQPQHSGLYLCAHCTARVSNFGSGTTLLGTKR
uniref:Ig-like domain-containing protein n=1 Tax=Bubo bubo TaxID=30461 RepID=A0A8C0G3T9_BUBBB